MLTVESVMKQTEVEYERVTGVKGVHSEQIKALAAALVSEINRELEGLRLEMLATQRTVSTHDSELALSIRKY